MIDGFDPKRGNKISGHGFSKLWTELFNGKKIYSNVNSFFHEKVDNGFN